MNQYWLGALLASYAIFAFGGYEFKKYQDQAAQTGAEKHEAIDLGSGFARSITDSQVLQKELTKDADPCLHNKLPIGIN